MDGQNINWLSVPDFHNLPFHRGIANLVPTVPSLEKICQAFGITLSQLFAEGDAPVALSESQRALLEQWDKLTKEQQEALFSLIKVM